MCSVISLIFASLIFPVVFLFAGLIPMGSPAAGAGVAPAVPVTTGTAASIEISADVTSAQVGDTLTITGVPVNIGLPYYTLTLSSGLTAIVTYENEVLMTGFDSNFRVLSMTGDMNQATFVLRALVPGTVEAVISATGEVTTPEGAFMWGGGASEPIELIVRE